MRGARGMQDSREKLDGEWGFPNKTAPQDKKARSGRSEPYEHSTLCQRHGGGEIRASIKYVSC